MDNREGEPPEATLMTFAQDIHFQLKRKLTCREEFALFAEIQRLRDLKDDSGRIEKALSVVIHQYWHWATHLVSQVMWSGTASTNEMVSIACEALLKTASRFDPTCGVRFCTYSRHRILGLARSRAMQEHRRRGHLLPLLEDSTPEESKFNHEAIQFRAVIQAQRDYDKTEPHSLPDSVDHKLKLERIQEQMKRFTPLTQQLLEGYYFRGDTLRALAARTGVSHETVRKRIQKATKALKQLNQQEE
jgi:RNA polymerase sigma factor (sigma-70 family)